MFHLLRKHLPIHQYCRLHRPRLYLEVLCVVSIVGMVVCLWQSYLEGTIAKRGTYFSSLEMIYKKRLHLVIRHLVLHLQASLSEYKTSYEIDGIYLFS